MGLNGHVFEFNEDFGGILRCHVLDDEVLEFTGVVRVPASSFM